MGGVPAAPHLLAPPRPCIAHINSGVLSRRSVKVFASSSAAMPAAQQQQGKHIFSPVTPSSPMSSDGSMDAPQCMGWRTNIENSYAKGKVLGQGSFGCVYQAVHLGDGHDAAIKELPLVRGKLTKQKTMEKLHKEVTILERLQECRSVVHLEDLFEDDTNVFVVTELCAGGDLQRFSDVYGPLNERCLALIAFEVALIIKSCHDYSVIHGDVKPANFCLKEEHVNPLCSSDAALRRSSWLKAIDFGCSQLHYGGQRLSKRSGTPVYMAPEIFQRSYSFEVDMWSLGVMLYQLYSRRFPFWEGDAYTRALSLDEVARAVTESPIRFNYGPWLQMSPEGLDFIQGCLTRNPEERLSVVAALNHPWLQKHRLSSSGSDTAPAMLSNNIAPFTHKRDAAVAA